MTGESGASREDILGVIRGRDVRVVFQPIVELATTEVVGFEARSRGPVGSSLETAPALFAAAREHGLIGELDWLCRAAAFTAFLDAKPPPSLSLFINAEPESLVLECPADIAPIVKRAEEVLRVTVEVSDRALHSDPAGLLAAERRARASGWGIALDEVGTGQGAIAMIPIMRPDVIKLDLRLLRSSSDADAAAVILAASRHAEHAGGSLCVDAINDADDARWARSLGARFGQGNFFGAPGPLPADLRPPRRAVPLVAPSQADAAGETPWDIVGDVEPISLDFDHYLEWARIVARGSIAPGAAPVIMAGVGRNTFDPEVVATFPEQKDPLLHVAFGVGIDPDPIPGIRGVPLAPGDPLSDWLFLVAISSSGSFALMGSVDPSGKILTVLTQEPHSVDDIARYLIRRIPRR